MASHTSTQLKCRYKNCTNSLNPSEQFKACAKHRQMESSRQQHKRSRDKRDKDAKTASNCSEPASQTPSSRRSPLASLDLNSRAVNVTLSDSEEENPPLTKKSKVFYSISSSFATS
jgi:hypothetical protein